VIDGSIDETPLECVVDGGDGGIEDQSAASFVRDEDNLIDNRYDDPDNCDGRAHPSAKSALGWGTLVSCNSEL
jgi:hypothetical protein